MAMPDFSFLQNQPGNTSFGDLAKGLAQGAQLGMNMQNMKLQQAAQQQQMELQKNTFDLEKMKYATAQIAQQARQKIMADIDVATKDLTNPEEVNRVGAMIAARHGQSDMAKEYGAAAQSLAEKAQKDMFQVFPVAGASGRTVNITARKVNDPTFVDPRLKAAGVDAPGYMFSSEGGEAAPVVDMGNNRNVVQQATSRGEAYNKKADASIEQQKWLDVFNEASQNQGAVPLPNLAEKLGGVASFLGVEIPEVKDLATANLATRQLGMAMLQRFVGTTTEKELGFSLDMAPAMWQDPKARAQLTSVLSKVGAMDRAQSSEHAKFVARSIKEGGGGIVADGKSWEEHWDEYSAKHPLVTPEQKKLFENRATEIGKIKESLVGQGVDPVSKRPVGQAKDGKYYYLDTFEQARTR